MAEFDHKEYARQMRENCGKDHNGNIICSAELWEQIASIIESTADVVPKSEEGAECPTCYGTGRIGTTDWLTKNISKKQLAEEKAKAIAEHEQYIKTEYAREIFEEIEKLVITDDLEKYYGYPVIAYNQRGYTELKKKYTEGEHNE